ncbi:MAG: hypothetical protein ACTSPS_07490 [Promethearchaeota archaeon]
MPPIYIHLIIGIVLAEIILRKIENDPIQKLLLKEERKKDGIFG